MIPERDVVIFVVGRFIIEMYIHTPPIMGNIPEYLDYMRSYNPVPTVYHMYLPESLIVQKPFWTLQRSIKKALLLKIIVNSMRIHMNHLRQYGYLVHDHSIASTFKDP